MDTYIINGVEIQYDTFDADNIEAFDEAVEHVAQESQTSQEGESPSNQLRRICRAMLDVFDRLCGEGTARAVFGPRINVKGIYEGYASFVQEVNQQMTEFAQEAPQLFAKEPPPHRAQRRAMNAKG